MTIKTNMLEVWNFETGLIENIYELSRSIMMVRWNPQAEDQLIAVADKSTKLYHINQSTGS